MAFLQRLIGYLANEVLVKGLAESQTFQRAAVAVHQASKVAKAQGNPPPPPPPPRPPPRLRRPLTILGHPSTLRLSAQLRPHSARSQPSGTPAGSRARGVGGVGAEATPGTRAGEELAKTAAKTAAETTTAFSKELEKELAKQGGKQGGKPGGGMGGA